MKTAERIFISLFFILSIMGCHDNRIRGCTDPDSINFNQLAERDDGSCEYEGEAVIWYGETASQGLINDGATALTFYVNGDVVGSSATTVFWAQEPNCGENGSITITRPLGRNKSQSYNLSVKDQDGIEYWNTTLTITGNTCLVFELTWAKRKK